VTPLNFVCKCRALPFFRRRAAIAARVSRRKYFPARDFRAIICSRCKNADVMRVFAKTDFQMFAGRSGRAGARSGRFATRNGAKTGGFTTRKKICAGGRFCRLGGCFEAKNERIGAGRFAPAARLAPRAQRRATPARVRFPLPFRL
jgi:hypothetical protein